MRQPLFFIFTMKMKRFLLLASFLLLSGICYSQGFDQEMIKAGKEFNKKSKKAGKTIYKDSKSPHAKAGKSNRNKAKRKNDKIGRNQKVKKKKNEPTPLRLKTGQ